MKALLVLLLLFPGVALAQSPFDGTWVVDTKSMELPQKPITYFLVNGMFRCSDCNGANIEIKTDGQDHEVGKTGYWDTVSVRVLDAFNVEIISKKAGKVMFTELDTISQDGDTLTAVVKDTTEAQAVTIETVSKRIDRGPVGSHILCGSWHAFKISRSKNGSTIKFKCTPEGFSAETPLGEKFNAKFNGKDYLVEDDPAHTMVSVKLLSSNSVEQTNKRDGKVVGVLRLTVAPGGETIHATYENKEANSTTGYVMVKQLQN
jgi:hypothetical protein